MSKVEIKLASPRTYTMTVERVITIDSKFNISPSYGYAGVEDGTVIVKDIIEPAEYTAAPHRFPEVTEFIECAHDTDEDIREAHEQYKDTVWVGYSYINASRGTTYYFPIQEFAQYISDVS